MTILAVLFFLMIMAAVSGAGYVFMRVRGDAGSAAEAQIGMGGSDESLQDGFQEALATIGTRLSRSGSKEDSLRRHLFQAGYRSPTAYLVFYGIQICLSVTLGLGLAWAVGLGKGSFVDAMLPGVCGLGFGFLLPARVLEYQVRARADRIRRAVPAALDLLVLAMEAGQSLDQALRDTAASLRALYPDLCAEFVFCNLEMGAGTARAEALRRLGERSGEDELRKLASLMIDGERFGTTMGPALRSHARYLRTRMRHRAQEKARKLGVKLVIPVFFLIFPSVVLVTLGPAYLKMREFLANFLQ